MNEMRLDCNYDSANGKICKLRNVKLWMNLRIGYRDDIQCHNMQPREQTAVGSTLTLKPVRYQRHSQVSNPFKARNRGHQWSHKMYFGGPQNVHLLFNIGGREIVACT